MKYLFILISIFISLQVEGQLLKNDKAIRLVRKGIDYTYNSRPDSARIYIDSVELALPNHPVVPMMRALNVLWYNIPLVTVDSVFASFSGSLTEAIKKAQQLDGGRQQDPEAIFFEMSARGLLAEYYADAGYYMKAITEAQKAYNLIKLGFDLTEVVPDFLLTSGVYNYFREKYPERHPVYKTFVWLFKSGDVEMGLKQLERATESAILTRVESSIYLSYIYLRYEYQPEMAQVYLLRLLKEYPNNLYIRTKYIESLVAGRDVTSATYGTIQPLVKSNRPYYQMSGAAFMGFYLEQITQNRKAAILEYKSGLLYGKEIVGHGEYYRAMCYLGLGRIYLRQKDLDQARMYLHKAIEEADTEDIVREAKLLLKDFE